MAQWGLAAATPPLKVAPCRLPVELALPRRAMSRSVRASPLAARLDRLQSLRAQVAAVQVHLSCLPAAKPPARLVMPLAALLPYPVALVVLGVAHCTWHPQLVVQVLVVRW